jgi:hypothetical protein
LSIIGSRRVAREILNLNSDEEWTAKWQKNPLEILFLSKRKIKERRKKFWVYRVF